MEACQYQELIQSVHKGLLEQPHWGEFLDSLRGLTSADYVSLAFKGASPDASSVPVMCAGQANTDRRYEVLNEIEDIAFLPYEQLEPLVVYNIYDCLDDGNIIHQKFIEYMRLRGINFNRVLRIKEPEGVSAWLAITREASDFDDEASRILADVAPHLAIAIRTLTLIERERTRAEIAADAVRRLNFGWFTLDASGSVVDLDSEVATLFRSLPAMSKLTVGRPFRAPTAAAQSALVGTLQTFSADASAPARAIHLLDDPWLDMLAVPVKSKSISSDPRPVAVVYVHGSGATNTDRCDQLIELFGLSQREARLALALSQGKGIAAAAQDIGLTLETARNYTKRIYAKTATHSQADLVRLTMASVVALT